MATALMESKRHRGAVLVCREETDWLVDSMRLAGVMESLLGEIESVFTDCDTYYNAFKVWATQLEKQWSVKPETYEEDVQIAIDRISATWLEVFKKTIPMIDWAEARGHCPNRAKSLRDAYSTMLAMERMDRGPMPPRMRDLTVNAVDASRRGDAKEVDPKSF